MTPVRRIALVAIPPILGLVALVVVREWSSPRPADPVVVTTAAPTRDRVTVPSVRFSDVTAEAGVDFVHTNGARGEKLLPEAMGSGVVIFDYDSDGRADLYFVNGRNWPDATDSEPTPTGKLYRNLGDFRFADVTTVVGLDVPIYGMGGAAGDFDNDGRTDLFVTGVGGDRLFRNRPALEGTTRFQDVTDEAGVGGPGGWPSGADSEFLDRTGPLAFSSSAAWLDYDGDGRLDLFVCRYVTWAPGIDRKLGFQLAGLGRAYGPPNAFDGANSVLYRNLGNGVFEDVTKSAGLAVIEPVGSGNSARPRAVGKSLGVCVTDADDDGWPDIVVANDTVRNFLFRNVASPHGGRRFKEIGLLAGVAYADGRARGGMGIDETEYRPGRRALVIGNFANEPNTFLDRDRPTGPLFADAALTVGIAGPSRPLLKFGALFFDYDLDGRPDLFTCNGHLEPDIARVQAGQTYAQPPQLFWNTGRGFEPVLPDGAGAELFRPLVGRGCAYADFDGDGDLDLVLTASGGRARIIRNDGPSGNWLRLRLIGNGTQSNRDAIGAVVTVATGGVNQRQEVRSGRGYLSQSELTLTFGLGATTVADSVHITWPGAAAGDPLILKGLAAGVHIISQPQGE